MSGQKLVNVGAATADTDVLTRTAADTRFLKQSDAATTYLTQAAATATYLSQASAATNYAPASGSTVYASKTELGNYYTTTQAQQQFAPISGSQAYAPITGSSNYASTSSLNNYAPKASPSFTGTVTSAGTVDAPVVKADYIASPALPLSGTHGFLFDAGVNPSGGIAQSPTTIYLVAPNQTGAAVSCVKNVAGALTYVPVNVAEPTASPAAVTLNYFNTHAANSSDARLKEAIAPIDNGTALNKLLDLTPVSYTYRPDGSASLGLIANAVADVVPEAVREMEGFEDYVQEGEPKIKGVVPMALVALLIGAVKELTARIETLEAKV
jgi:hypothetical protein